MDVEKALAMLSVKEGMKSELDKETEEKIIADKQALLAKYRHAM